MSGPIEPIGNPASSGWRTGAAVAVLFLVYMIVRVAGAVAAGRL